MILHVTFGYLISMMSGCLDFLRCANASKCSALGGFAPEPLTRLCPWTPLGAAPPNPCYRVALAGSSCRLSLAPPWKNFYGRPCFRVRFFAVFSAQCFHRTNRRAIAMMFVCLSVCVSVLPSVTGVHCDYSVHFNAHLSLWLDSPMYTTGHPDTKACPPTASRLFPVQTRHKSYGN